MLEKSAINSVSQEKDCELSYEKGLGGLLKRKETVFKRDGGFLKR